MVTEKTNLVTEVYGMNQEKLYQKFHVEPVETSSGGSVEDEVGKGLSTRMGTVSGVT